jgi:two-component system response regulator ResD
MDRQDSLFLVEDEHALRELVAQFLRQSGYPVVEAADGREAVDRYEREGPFGLVLLDLNLPYLGGVEVCRRIRLVQPSQAVLIVSAAIMPEHERSLSELGVEHYLTKPYHPETLLRAVRGRLDATAPASVRPPHRRLDRVSAPLALGRSFE